MIVKETTAGFEYWTSRPYQDEALRVQIQRATILLVPREDVSEHDGPLFAEGTADLFAYLQENSAGRVELATSDDDYRELGLYHDHIVITEVLLQWVFLPVVTSLLANWLWSKVHKEDNRTAKVTLTVEEQHDGQTRRARLEIEGPVPEVMRELRELTERRPSVPYLLTEGSKMK
jgi:hypothetical protein